MSIAEFVSNLRDRGIGPGAAWHKADFHVHMPGSSDYEYKSGDAPEQLARALSEAKLSFAVVLKHQDFPTRQEVASLQKLCPNTTIVPGAELNVFVDALSKKVNKDYFFHCIVAVDPDTDGDYPSSSSNLAMPKSSSCTRPARVTRTFGGLMSRCTISRPWA